mmetsp:Transcript_8426/g.8375  ORF Transcript_8426/g.8375 Transcript_8426/m.8375 type:complete len:1737 (-) Transcript_8426:378-5588(-)
MDIIGAVGYSGQDFVFLGQETFGYITGKSICIVGTSNGPKEMIWRHETGIGRIASHPLSHRIVIAPEIAKFDVEVVDIVGQNPVVFLKNPSTAKILDVTFSRDAELVFAISGSLDPKVFAWDVKTRELLFVSDLPVNFTNIAVNPADRKKFILSGDEGLYMGTIIETMSVSTIKFDKIDLNSPEFITLEEDDDAVIDETSSVTVAQITLVTFAVWAPFNRVFIGTKGGSIVELNSIDLTLRLRAVMPKSPPSDLIQVKNIPLCATISSSNLLIGTSNGDVFWFPVVEIDSSAIGDQDGEDNTDVLCQSIQSTKFESAVRCLQTDHLYVTVLAGTSMGAIMKFPLDIAEVKRDEGDEDNVEGTDIDRTANALAVDDVSNQTIVATNVSSLQAGAVLCCKSLSLPVLSTSETTPKTSVVYCSIFVTGSHTGLLTFWRQPSVDSEAIVKDGSAVPGIRKSTPRTIKVIRSMSVSSSSPGSGTETPMIQQHYPCSAIATIEYLPFNQKTGYGLIMVGTMDGFFESWKVCAFEAEEDEEVVHADEEDATIKLRFVKYFRRLMFHSPLSVLTCSTEEKKFFNIALGSVFSELVFILKVPNDYSSTPILNFTVNVHSPPASCVWNGRIFWIGCQNGLLCSFNPSRGQKKERNESNPHASWETNLPSITSMCSANKGEFLVMTSLSNDLLTILSVQSESNSSTHSSVFGESSLKFRNPSKASTSHRDMVVCVASAPNSTYVAAGCVDGSVHLWSIISGDIKLAAKAILHRQAVLSLSFSADSSLIMSCGADGSVFFSTVNVPARLFFKAALGDSKFYEKVTSGDEQKAMAGRQASFIAPKVLEAPSEVIISETWFEAERAEALEELKKRSAIKVSEVFGAVEDISFRLKSILDRNNGRSEEMEKVDRTDLVVDLDGRDRTYLENEKLLDSTRNLYSMRNLWNEVNASRVREICWDSMETHERQILPFNGSVTNFVSSFSIQGSSNEEKKRIEIIKRLRGVEIRSQRAHHQGISQRLPTFEASIRTSWAKSISGFSSSISWIANDGSRWPSQNVVATLLRKEKGEDPLEVKAKEKSEATTTFGTSENTRENSGLGDVAIQIGNRLGATSLEDEDELSTTSLFELDREIDENSIFNLLYAPEAVRTQTQKRTQILLLTEIARMLRANFNSFFEELANEKEDVMASIELRNLRLENILEELKQVEPLFIPKLMNRELRGAAIIITDEELTSRPYESDAIRAARLRDEEAKKNLLSQDETEDFKGRALEEMMNGTLEVKRDVFADVAALQKPSWMEELSLSEMTESQVKETEAFEVKLKVVQEEQLKYRKLLEQEMKKLKTETTEACKTFDEKVANVGRIKILVQREILTQELYTSRLGLTMAKREQSWGMLKSTEAQIEVMRKERAELRVRSERFNVHVEAMKNSLNAIQEEERSLDKTFKRDFQTLCNNNFDQDSLKVFADLFRRREYAASPDDDDDGSQDPDAEESDMLASGSQRGSRGRSKQASARGSKRNPNASSRRNAKALGASKKNPSMGSSKKGGGIGAGSRMMKASKGGNARSTAGGGKERLGPMQEAAQALKNAQQPEANEKDPYFIDLLQKDKLVRIAESKIPLLMSLNIDSDCPENFVVDQYTWSKLQDLRNVRIEKEIASKRMAIEYIEQRRKLDDLTNEENAIVSVIRSLRQARDETLLYLESIETNLEVLVCLKQGQDEVDRNAVVTEYTDAVLVPTAVVDTFNSRIKGLDER